MMLSIIIFLPLLGALVIGLSRHEAAKMVAFVFAALTFVLALTLLDRYPGIGVNAGAGSGAYFVEQYYAWMPALGIGFHLGMDGLSWLLVALTALLGMLCVAASFNAIHDREKEYYIFLLALESGVLGTFLALDLALFYIFWEMMLIPLYFLIGLFGSSNRIYATVKFLLFTFFGSVFMLVAILYVYAKTGQGGLVYTADLPEILARLRGGALNFGPIEEGLLFLGFFIAFAIKVPLFPLHTWLPDAHTEAPTAGSVMLAGVLLKTGVYGMVRFCIPLFPTAAVSFAPLILALSTIAIIYGALGAIAQTDMKRLVAYSSVSHMGFIMLGLFVFNEMAVTGAMLQMINHGISTSGLFLCVGMLYERRHTRALSEFGGLAANMKTFAILAMIMMLSSVGLPLLNGFVGEYWILAGTFQEERFLAGLGALGVVLGAVYLLRMYKGIFFGPLDQKKNGGLADLCQREVWILMPLVILAFWIGVYSKPFTDLLAPASQDTVAAVEMGVRALPAPTAVAVAAHE